MPIRMTLLLLVLGASLASAENAAAPEAAPAEASTSASTAASTAASPPAPADANSTAQLVQRLDDVDRRLIEINEYLRKPSPELAGIAVALPVKTKAAEAVLGGAREANPSASDLLEFEAVVQKLRNLERIFEKWRIRLQQEIALLDPWRAQLRLDAGYLRDTAGAAHPGRDTDQADAVPDALRGRLLALADSIETIRSPLRKRLDVVVGADVRVGELQTEIRDLQGQLEAARVDLQQKPLAITSPPIWKLPDSLREPVDLSRQNAGTLWLGVVDYLDDRPFEVGLFVLVMCVLLAGVARLRRSILAQEGDAGANELIMRYPFTAMALVWTVVGPLFLLPELPLGLGLLRGLAAIALVWRVLPVLLTPGEARAVKVLLVLTGIYLVQVVVLGHDWYSRVLTAVLSIVALPVFRALARHSVRDVGGQAFYRRALYGVAVVAPAILGVGLIANVVGALSLGQQAISGIFYITLVLCGLLAADAILRSILDAWIGGPGARWSRGVRHWPGAVRTWGQRSIRLMVFLVFVNVLPTIFPVLEPVWQAVGQFLTTAITMGTVELSLGDLLWFVVGIALAFGVARFVRFTLDEDVLPRLPLATGAASAASRLIYYALVVIGILFALAASGVELSKLTLLVSALGVGIGFGLQNIVNNFVSGLILAFERPVREGDHITLGQTTGRVEVIGLRATRIRTFDGAEVMVPNANLIAGELTNWTLSDRARRIEVTVGVDYGSDPVQVQEVLLECIRDLPSVAAKPAATSLFRGFGASSLDFSLLIWTDDADQRPVVESGARIRMLSALRAAGIGIPFPQLDVRLRRDQKPPDLAR